MVQTVQSNPRAAASPLSAAYRSESFAASAGEFLHALPGLIGDRVELLSLEVIRASHALAKIVALLVVLAILGVTAWLAAWVGIGAALIQLGMAWPFAVLTVIAVNLLSCWWALNQMRRLAPMLALPATRRHLSFHRRQPLAGSEGAA